MNTTSENAAKPGKAPHAGRAVQPRPAAPAEGQPPEGLRALALDYPLALVGGGLVVGVLIGAMFPKTRAGKLSKSALALAGVAGELGLSYARKAIDNVSDAAQTAASTSGRMAEVVSERTGELLDSASETASEYSEKAVDTAESAVITLRNSAEGLARQVIKLTSQLRH